jgi:hypothetical protein
VAWVLVVAGAVLVVFTFLLAFTLYGEIALVVGVACLISGIWLMARRPDD